MKRRFTAAITAFMLLWTVCVPSATVYAQDTYGEPGTEIALPEEGAGTESTPEENSTTAPEPPPSQEGAEQPTEESQESEHSDEIPPEPIEEQQQEDTPAVIVHSVRLDDTELLFLPIGGDPSILLLPETAYALYGGRGFLMRDISWCYDELDTAAPGRQMLTGEVTLPDGYAFEGEPLTVSTPVLVYDAAGEPTEQIATCLYADGPNAIIPLGTDRDELADYFTHIWPEAYLTTEAGDTFPCAVTLDLNAIDPDTAGTYFPVALELPGGVGLTDVFAYYALSVYVAPEDQVDLGAVSLYQSGYLVQWLYAAQNPVLWASVDGAEWSPAETQSDFPLLNHYGRFIKNDEDITGLELFFAQLPPDHLYKFQVQYDGERFSKVLVLDLVNNTLPHISGEQGGDRNGGDREENRPPNPETEPPTTPEKPPVTTEPPPDEKEPEKPPTGGGVVTPPPTDGGEKEPGKPPAGGDITPPATGSHESSVPEKPIMPTGESERSEQEGEKQANDGAANAQPTLSPTQAAIQTTTVPPASVEYTDSHSITLSGERVLAMAQANPNMVSFLRGELRVSVPTAYVNSLRLRAADTFTVTLYQPDEDSFEVGFAVNQSPLTEELPEPFSVRIPWNEGVVSCVAADMEAIPASLDTTTAEFTLHHPGTYTLIQKDSDAVPVSQQSAGTTTASHSGTNASDNFDTRETYSDSWMPILLTGLTGFIAAAAFLLWRKKGGWHCDE